MLLVAALAGALYLAGARRLARRGRRWDRGRTAAFAGGVVALAAAAAASRAEGFPADVAEHLLIGMAAPLLLALGAPVTLALQASSRPSRTALLRALHARPLAVLFHPVVTWGVFGGSLFLLYFTPLFELSERHGLVHGAVHLHFLLAGAAFFWPLVSPDPVPQRVPHGARVLLVLLTVPFHAVLGLALVSGGGDRAAGGALLWAGGDVLGLVASGVVLAQWMRQDQREALRYDRRTRIAGAAPEPPT